MQIDQAKLNNAAAGLLNSNPNKTTGTPDTLVRDTSWISTSFITIAIRGIVPLEPQEIENEKFCSADMKFSETAVGMHSSVNPPPQACRYTDIRSIGLRPGAQEVTLGPAVAPIGMGRYYSEAIDDNRQEIHLRFGRPRFNSLMQFFTGFYSSAAGDTARAGTFDSGFINWILRGVGTVIGLAVAPLVIIPMAINFLGLMGKVALHIPTSKYYSLKPTMELYWMTVQSLLNQLTIALGITFPTENPYTKKVFGSDFPKAQNEVNVLHDIIPDFIDENGAINVKAIISNYKIMEMSYSRHVADTIDEVVNKNKGNISADKLNEAVRRILTSNSLMTRKWWADTSNRPSLEMLLQKYIGMAGEWFTGATGAVGNSSGFKDPRSSANFDPKAEYKAPTNTKGFSDYFLASWGDGFQWASFCVDYTGSVRESFTNSTRESALSGTINSMSKTAASARFSVADGNIDSLGIIDGAVNALKNVVGAATSVLHIEGLWALAGNAFVEIPKHWDDSSASFPQSNYTMTLQSPYGNPVSQVLDMYLPLCMLLAGALPLSTGKQSYTSPYLCEVYDKGRCISRLAMIGDLSVTRGTSNLGFNNDGRAMAIEVSFSIMDLSTVMTVPIRPNFSLMPLDGLFDAENKLEDYIQTMAATSLADQVYNMERFKKRIKKVKADFMTTFTKANLADSLAQMGPFSFGAIFCKGVSLDK